MVTVAANTSTGTQDFTVAGFGTPKGAIFLVSYGTANGTAVNHAMLSVGFTDGTRQRAIGIRVENAVVGGSDTGNIESSTACILTALNSADTTDGVATFDSWITDGVRVNWTDAPPSAYLVTCILFGGSGVSNVYVDDFTTPGVVDTAQDITAPGFQPDVVISFSAINAFNDTNSSTARPSLGFAVRDGSDTQRSASWTETDNASPAANILVVDTNSVARNATGGAGAAEAQVTDWDANGFSIYQRANTTVLEGIFFCFKLNGLSAKVATVATPTSTGSNSVTGVGFTPQFCMLGLTSALLVDTVYSDDNAECFGVGVATPSLSSSLTMFAEDGSTDSDATNMIDNKIIRIRKDRADFITATLTGFTSDGMTLNYTVVDASARQQIGLFIQAGTGGISRLLGGKLIGKLGRD